MRKNSGTADDMVAAVRRPTGLRVEAVLDRASSIASSAGAGALALGAIAIAGAPVRAAVWQVAVAAGIACAFWLIASLAGRSRVYMPLGVAMVGAAAWLLAQVSYPAGGWFIAATLGAGVALAGCGRRRPRRGDVRAGLFGLAPAVAVAAALVVVRALAGRDAAMGAGAGALALCAALSLGQPAEAARTRRAMATGIGGALLALLTVAYMGATTPSATWFGSLVHHGPRDSSMVAITFDDGPDPPYTLEIRDILDRYGAKGTFFTVGKALEARPDVSRALLDDGHLLGNHSYHHDAFRWLDPRYPELDETQSAFKRTLGVCPALYRPPHGSHTPFMAKVVDDRGMTMVTWDVSAADWATTDGDLVARRVLEKVKPGSIIVLHDGIDGNIGADRSVVLQALPIILDGLRERGLEPVTLDKLLGVPAYLESC
jgi:peptidoglycan/xylan/chitin deacetylase (PgdA/CDA1 family)